MTAERREAVGCLKATMSERRACRSVEVSRTVYRYSGKDRGDRPLIDALAALARDHSDLGFGKFYAMLRADGHGWNHKRVHRVYCAMKLNKRRKHKRRLPSRNPEPLSVPEDVNQSWSADFMGDALMDGRRFRTSNVIDDCRREALAIEIDLNLPSQRVVRVLDRIAEARGYPAKIRFDNGPELTSIAVAEWAETNSVELEFIEPGRPMQNGFIERFNRTYREAVLDMYMFESLDQVRELTAKWMGFYNDRRPHDSLGGMPPRSSRGHLTVDPEAPV